MQRSHLASTSVTDYSQCLLKLDLKSYFTTVLKLVCLFGKLEGLLVQKLGMLGTTVPVKIIDT